MKKTLIATVFAFLIGIVPAQALFLDLADTKLVVSQLEADMGDGEATLTWSVSPDSNGDQPAKFVVHQGTKSVAEGLASSYDEMFETAEKTYKLSGLENGKTYYVAVKAFGQNGEEGSMSKEIEVVPSSGADPINNEGAPRVVKAEALTSTLVKLEFSEDVILPTDSPELSFSVTDEKDDTSFLLVWSVEYDKEDDKEVFSRVILTTDEQDKGRNYLTTVSALITDKDENPIESGLTDSATFIGTDKTELETDALTQEVVTEENTQEGGDEQVDSATDEAEVVLEGETEDSLKEAADEAALDIDALQKQAEEEARKLAEQEQAEEEAAVEAEEPVVEVEKEEVVPVVDTTEAVVEVDEEDTTPPAEVQGLAITFKQRVSDFLVKLTWGLSPDAVSEKVDQIIYHSLDKGKTWGQGKNLGEKATSYETTAKPETEQTFKVTTRDVAGNESQGVIKSVRLPALPKTGAPILIALGAGLSMAGLSGLRKKK
ncbi:MAG: fibronectin type III domain-containing protein [Candidatus Gracilibacteria bacterium]|jgi:hypothetical protein|nr:fibronectin type III domain-containing protein [Candidatus Gracilibacteria bacterium]